MTPIWTKNIPPGPIRNSIYPTTWPPEYLRIKRYFAWNSFISYDVDLNPPPWPVGANEIIVAGYWANWAEVLLTNVNELIAFVRLIWHLIK